MKILTERKYKALVDEEIAKMRELDIARREAVDNLNEHDKLHERINRLSFDLEDLRQQFRAHCDDTKTDHAVCEAISRTGAISTK